MSGALPPRAALRELVRPLVAPAVADDLDALDDRVARAVWSVLVEPGDGVAGSLIAAHGPGPALGALLGGSFVDAATDPPADVTPATLRAAVRRWAPRLRPEPVVAALRAAVAARVRLVVPGDDGWLPGVADLAEHAPLALWVRGDPTALAAFAGAPSAAIVGARASTGYGEHVAAELAGDLAARGVGVASGAAFGIDGAAHRGALAVGGRTIAVLAGGVDRAYPSAHRELIDRIAATTAVVSEVACGGAPTKWRFLQRNRLLAALSGATVVVEAGARSGSLNTAGHAAALGRPLGAVPGPVTSASSSGCHRLLREFDAQCVTSPDDVVELLGLARAAAPDAGRPRESTRILDALSTRSPRSAEEIARRAGLAIADVESALGTLSLAGAVRAEADGWLFVP